MRRDGGGVDDGGDDVLHAGGIVGNVVGEVERAGGTVGVHKIGGIFCGGRCAAMDGRGGVCTGGECVDDEDGAMLAMELADDVAGERGGARQHGGQRQS